MTKENAGRGEAGTASGVVPTAPPAVPPAAPPAGQSGSQDETHISFSDSPLRTTPGSPASGAARPVPEQDARLGRWIRRQGPLRIGGAAAAFVAVGVLLWLLTATLGGTGPSGAEGSPAPDEASASSAPAVRGALPLEGVNPLDFRLGDCFKDFDPDAPQSTVVACDTAHSAQLVAIEVYAPADVYPGREPLKQKALDACKGAPLTEKSAGYDLSYKLAYPSSSSWGSGDRRVDCFVTAATGNTIMESLLPAQ